MASRESDIIHANIFNNKVGEKKEEKAPSCCPAVSCAKKTPPSWKKEKIQFWSISLKIEFYADDDAPSCHAQLVDWWEENELAKNDCG